jgi:hypothetical protein
MLKAVEIFKGLGKYLLAADPECKAKASDQSNLHQVETLELRARAYSHHATTIDNHQVVTVEQEAMEKASRMRKATENSLATTQHTEESKLLRNTVSTGNLVFLQMNAPSEGHRYDAYQVPKAS